MKTTFAKTQLGYVRWESYLVGSWFAYRCTKRQTSHQRGKPIGHGTTPEEAFDSLRQQIDTQPKRPLWLTA